MLTAHLASGVLTHTDDPALVVHNQLQANNVHGIHNQTELSVCSSGAKAGNIHERQPVSHSSHQQPLALHEQYSATDCAMLSYCTAACLSRLTALSLPSIKPDCTVTNLSSAKAADTHLQIVRLRPCDHSRLDCVGVEDAEAPMPADAAAGLVRDTPPDAHRKPESCQHAFRLKA
jgi:hypothetical protein